MVVYSIFIYKNYQKMRNEMNKMVSHLTNVSNNLVTYNSAVEKNLEKTRIIFSDCYSNIQNTLDAMRKMKIDETIAFENRKNIINNAAETMNTTLTNSVNLFKNNVQNQLNATQQIINSVEKTMQESLTSTKIAVGKTDDTLQRLLESMSEYTETQLNDFKRLSVTNKDELLRKLDEFPVLAEELRNLTEIKTGINAFESVICEQNQRFDNLCSALKEFIESQAEKKSDKSFLSKLTGK